EVVGIELELVALEQAAVLIDIHGERCDVACDVQLPMPVAGRFGLEIDEFGAVRENAVFPGHVPPLCLRCFALRRRNMQYIACIGASPAQIMKTCILLHATYSRPAAPILTKSALVSRAGIAGLSARL